MRRFSLCIIFVALWPATALADLTEAQLEHVALGPVQGASVPTGLVFKNLDGNNETLGEAIAGKPTLLLPADFTCSQICGPALSIAATALNQTGLRAGADYSLIVVGIDSHDGIDDARHFTTGQVGGPGVSVLSGDEPTIQSLMISIGYRVERDAANDAIAHPAALVSLTSDGHVSRVLSSLALQPTDLRLALVEAGDGKIEGLAGRLSLLCYGFDAAHGIYTRQIATILRIAGGLTIAVMAALIGLMISLARSRRASV